MSHSKYLELEFVFKTREINVIYYKRIILNLKYLWGHYHWLSKLTQKKRKMAFVRWHVSTMWLLNTKVCHLIQMEYIKLLPHFILCSLKTRKYFSLLFKSIFVFSWILFVQRQNYKKLISICIVLIELLIFSKIKMLHWEYKR